MLQTASVAASDVATDVARASGACDAACDAASGQAIGMPKMRDEVLAASPITCATATLSHCCVTALSLPKLMV